MGKRILVPVDDSEQARRANALAVELFPEETIVLLHVINPADAGFNWEAAMPSFPEGWYDQQQEHAESLLDDIEAENPDADYERVVELGQPAQTIAETIEAEDIDHVVMGSHGRRGVSRLLLGSVAETVVRKSPVPVTIVR